MTQLTKAQKRYLDEIRAAGQKKYPNRSRQVLGVLRAAGLIEIAETGPVIIARPVGVIEVRVGLAPPRRPGGDRQERNWTLIIAKSNGNTQHVSLYGTRAGDAEGAQAVANRELHQEWGWKVIWEPIGTGFKVAPFTIYKPKENATKP